MFCIFVLYEKFHNKRHCTDTESSRNGIVAQLIHESMNFVFLSNVLLCKADFVSSKLCSIFSVWLRFMKRFLSKDIGLIQKQWKQPWAHFLAFSCCMMLPIACTTALGNVNHSSSSETKTLDIDHTKLEVYYTFTTSLLLFLSAMKHP